MHYIHMEIRPFVSNATVLSFLTVSSVALVKRRGPQHECWCCSTTDLGVDEEQSSCVLLDSPASGAKTRLSSRAFLRMRWKEPCASCSAKSGRISIMTMMVIRGPLQTTTESGPNHMKVHCVRPAEMASAYRMTRIRMKCAIKSVTLTFYLDKRI